MDLLDARLEKQGFVYSDAGVTEYLTRLGMAVIPDQPAPEHVTWKFRALRDSTTNAFALPNGSIYVHSGLLALLENEDQLASVLAHEATHVLARHGYLSYRSYRKKATAGSIIALDDLPNQFNGGGRGRGHRRRHAGHAGQYDVWVQPRAGG